MKIECTKEKLLQAISKAEKISSKNPALPILSCLLFKVENNNLKIKATNMDIGIESEIPVKCEENGTIAVPGSVLNNLLLNTQIDKSVVFETTNNNLQVKTEHIKSTIKAYPSDDFPTIPKISDGMFFVFDIGKFVTGLKSVVFSSSLSSVKPELSAVYIYSEGDDFVFVATDSSRLAEKKIKNTKNNNSFNVLIPLKNIQDMIKIFEGVVGDVDICLSKNQISFSYERNYLVSRVVSGIFPDYRQVLPKDFKTEVIVLKQDLLSVLKISNVFSDKFNQVNIKIIPSKKIFEITTKNSNIGETVNSVPASLSGEDIIVNFNYKYIYDCLQVIESDSISLSFNGISKPLLIRGVSDKTFSYIVMPMNK